MAEEDNNSIPTWAKVAGGVAVVGGIACKCLPLTP
jgi:hypothetical protein